MHSGGRDGVVTGALHDSSLTHEQRDDDVRQIGVDREHMQTLVTERRFQDTSGEFFVVPHVTGSPVSEKDIRLDVALVTQCSLSHVQYLSFLAKRWDGIISLTLFLLPEQLHLSFAVISVLRKCHDHIRDHVIFHIVFPVVGDSTLEENGSRTAVPAECREGERFVQSLKIGSHRNYGEEKIAYPNNLLRNIGRRYAGTEWTLVTDIDMVPSIGLRESFLHFVTTGSHVQQKLVYVLPAYEVPEQLTDSLIPGTKRQLLDMIERLDARPFYMELCWKCQKVTGYAEWEHMQAEDQPPNQDQLSILHTVRWRDPWEPFYISRNDVPFYDERFRRYGFNRISQVCETHVAGYDFAVLNNGFLVHRGWKRKESFHADNELDQERNRILFRSFKSLLSSRYATGTRTCS